MAYGLKYRYEFQDWPKEESARDPYLYRVSFLAKDYTGAVTTLLPGDRPLSIEADGVGKYAYSPIPQKYTFKLMCESTWQASGFYVQSDRDMKVQIEVDKTFSGNSFELLRQGWVLSADLKEPYAPKPYPIEISAACGLSTLKTRPILDADGKRLSGKVSISQVMRTALARTDLVSHLIAGFNLYDVLDVSSGLVNGLVPVGKCPLHQTTFNAERLLDSEGNPISCYDALIMCLTTAQGVLTQLEGRWWALRKPEMGGGYDFWNTLSQHTIRVRQYFSIHLDEAPVDNLDKAVDLTTQISFTGELNAEDGTETYLSSTKPGVRIAQEFGASLGEVPTFDEVDSTGLPIGWTSQNMGNNERYVTGTGTDVDPKKLVIIGGGDEKINGATPSVYCRIDYPAGSLENKDGVFMTRRIKAQFRLSEVRAAKVWVVIQRDDEPYLLSNGQWIRFSKLKKADSVATLFYNIYTVDGVQKTKPGWADLNLELPAIDRVYSIIIYLGRAELLDQPNPNIPPKVEYARVRMETSQEGLSLNGTQQTIVRPGESVKDTTLTIQLGDVPAVAQPERRVGTLYHISGVPTRLWFKANANVSAPGNGIAGGMTLLSTIAQHEAKQAMFPAKQIEGDLLGDLPYGPLTMLTTDDMADLGKAFLTRWEWIVDECSHSISAERLMADQTGLPQTVKEWDTPDGLLPMAEGEDGSPVSPAEKKNFREDDQLLKRLIALGVVTPNLKAIPSQNGFTPLDGRGKLTANVYVGGVLKGTIASRLRKLALTLDDLLK